MAFQKPKKQPEFASLKTMLAQIASHKDLALYQTIQLLIERLTQFQGLTVQDIADINASINDILSITNISADKLRTYITEIDETLKLPNSRRLVAGTNITFDLTTPGEFEISASGGPGPGSTTYDSPLSDGDLVQAEIIFADGSPVIVQVPI